MVVCCNTASFPFVRVFCFYIHVICMDYRIKESVKLLIWRRVIPQEFFLQLGFFLMHSCSIFKLEDGCDREGLMNQSDHLVIFTCFFFYLYLLEPKLLFLYMLQPKLLFHTLGRFCQSQAVAMQRKFPGKFLKIFEQRNGCNVDANI